MDKGKGHIKLGGDEYAVDLRSYKRRDITDFSPRASAPGGSIYSELGLYQTLSLQSFQGGFGYPWHTETRSNVYLRTEGNIDTRQADAIQLMTKPTKSTDLNADGFIEFGGDIWAWSTDGVKKYVSTSATWDLTVNTDSVRDMWHNGHKIFVARELDTIQYAGTDATASSDWTETGATTDQSGAFWIQHHDGFVYAGKEAVGGSDGHYVFFDDSILMSNLYLVSSDDPDAIPVGVNGQQVKKPITYRGDFLFPRPDGVFRMDKDRGGARVILDYRDQTSTDNFRSMAIHNGQVIFPVRDTLFQWNGLRTIPITPPRFSHKYPYDMYGQFDNFTVNDRFLYMSARTSSSDYEEHIICYDGVGWHKIAEPIKDSVNSIDAMYYDPVNNFLWYEAGGEVYYIRFRTRADFPYDEYYVLGDVHPNSTDQEIVHSLYTPRIAAGYRRVTKSMPSVLLEGQNMSTSHYVELFYALDGSTSFLPWGGDSGLSNVMTSDGVLELFDPEGPDQSTLEFNNVQFRLDLVTSVSTATPILEGFYPRILMRPDTLFGWSMSIKASPNIQYGTSLQDKTPKQIVDEIKAHRDSKAPLDFVDIYGDTYKVYVSAMNETAVEEHVGRAGASPEVEQVVNVNLVQVG